MKRTVKLLALVLVLTLVLTLAACGKSGSENGTTAASSGTNVSLNGGDNINANVNGGSDSKEDLDTPEDVTAPETEMETEKETENGSEPAMETNAPVAPADEGSVVGAWKTVIPFGKMTDMFEEETDEVTELIAAELRNQDLVMYFIFGADGIVTTSIDEQSVQMISLKVTSMIPALLASQMDMDLESLQAALEEEGMSMNDFLAECGIDPEEMAQTITDTLLSSDTPETEYTVEGDKVTMHDEYTYQDIVWTVSISGDTMTVTDIEGNDKFLQMLPWVFTRAD